LSVQLFQLLNWQYRQSGGARRTIQSGRENEVNFREVRGGVGGRRTNCTIDPALELLRSDAFL
jgi:hypothetical protein